MESEDSTNGEDVSMNLLTNKAEIPAGDLDVTKNGNEEFENILYTSEYEELWRKRKHMQV